MMNHTTLNIYYLVRIIYALSVRDDEGELFFKLETERVRMHVYAILSSIMRHISIIMCSDTHLYTHLTVVVHNHVCDK